MGGINMSMDRYQTDTFQTSEGELKITFLGHGSLYFEFGGKVIQVDPYGNVADYSQLPKADIVLLTHEHHDHLDPAALKKIRTQKTKIVMTASCVQEIKDGIVMKNGDERTVDGLHIRAVPAYNVMHKRDNGQPYHPRGTGNGYVLTFGDMRIYVAGDTENIPEMKAIGDIDVAFLPMNLPYTMTPEMVADAARTLRSGILYPYHYGQTDTSRLEQLLEGEEIEVRIRELA
jgi:L-ascorbate metabolism protein UlaG (beta-lactamase superfamily)